MNYRHRLDITGQCVDRGDAAEYACYKVLKHKGKDVRMATPEEQKRHIDVVVMGDKDIKIDVKARKKIGHQDKVVSGTHVWLELFSKGFPGWLLGDEDYVAFEITDSEFFVVKREALLEYFIKITLPQCEIVESSDQAYHKWYKRENGIGTKIFDIITTITYDELFSLPGYKLKE